MPPGGSWLRLTLTFPFWGTLITVLALAILLIIGVVLWVRRARRQKIRLEALEVELQELRSQAVQAASDTSGAPNSPVESAYLQFIYNISHEVANPLQSMQTNLDNMARCTPEETARWKQYHDLITAEIRRLSELTESLRLLSRLEAPGAPVKREPVNLKGVIEGVMMAQVETAEANGMRLLYNGPERPARVLGDRDHLRQVLLNLVDNGIKYGRPGGGEVIINVQEEGQRLLVRVIDDGIGISPDDLPYVFDTAYQAPHTGSLRRAGSGLGLAIVKRIVEQHGGQIRIHSQPGQGTTVAFDLPLYVPS